MSEPNAEVESMDPALLRRRVLERVRFEQSMGVEFLPRVALAPVDSRAEMVAVTPPMQAARATVPAVVTPQTVENRVAAAPQIVVRPSSDLGERWRALEARALGCVTCVLHESRTNVVFGAGNRKAKLVFVGQGPGKAEDEQGQPFVGDSGEFLNKIIAAMGRKREEVYLLNVVKCRSPKDRAPLPDEIVACSNYLSEQLELIAPKVIVALGGVAAKALLKTDAPVANLRGRWYSYKDIPVMPTLHPAYVLWKYTDENRRAVWDDMKKVMEKLKTAG